MSVTRIPLLHLICNSVALISSLRSTIACRVLCLSSVRGIMIYIVLFDSCGAVGACVSSAPTPRSRGRCARACRTRSRSWCRRGSCGRCGRPYCSCSKSGRMTRGRPRGSSARYAQSCCSCSTTARRGFARTHALCGPFRYICVKRHGFSE